MSKPEGYDQLMRNISLLEENLGKAVSSALISGGKLVEGEAKSSIQKRSQGNAVVRYREGGGRVNHIASAPGDAPNTDTGRLVGSIQTEVNNAGVFVGTQLEYGKHQEFGTTDMDARPWLMPALEKRKAQVKKLVAIAVEKTTRRAAR